MDDALSKRIVTTLKAAGEPLETKEVEAKLKGFTRTKIFYRLLKLRGEQKVNGKFVGPGKGVWIWWSPGAF
jgi:hypothetical protein